MNLLRIAIGASLFFALSCGTATTVSAYDGKSLPRLSAEGGSSQWVVRFQLPTKNAPILAVAYQGAKQDDATRISPRAWGKIIKVGIICLVLVGGGAVWLFNKLKPQ